MDDSRAFLEVVAYLKGVADAVAAQSGRQAPVSLRPFSFPPFSLRAVSTAPPSLRASSLPPGLLRSLSLRPLSLAPSLSSFPHSSFPHTEGRRRTLRFGELPFERGSTWPQVALGSSWEPTRGGSRMIDPESLHPVPDGDLVAVWRRTLPYGAPAVSLAALAAAAEVADWGDGERNSEVRLRSAVLPHEWYELTGSDSV